MTPSITDTAAITALGDWLVSILPGGTPVFRGQDNRVPEPAQSNFVVMTPIGRARLAVSADTWDPTATAPTALNVTTSTGLDVQVDVHGPASADYVQIIIALFSDQNAYEAIAVAVPGLAPLTASDPLQLPFRNAEDEYEDRWTTKLTLQGDIVLTPPQDFANVLAVALEQTD
ncbi:MAG TPA: hypothetical protein VG248_03425 [Caulobacteraceae bacterium]|nr:hypothetical protein [Caulobacteraceae bacterium]